MKASNGWPRVKLGEHVQLLTGFPFKSQRFSADPNDTALVKGENVAQGKIGWEISKRWPADELDQFEQYRLQSGDVVLAMDRPWIEAGLKYAWIKPHDPVALLVQRVSRLRGLPTLDQTFLRYIIGSPAFTDYIRPIVTGVNVPHISPQQIKDFQFRLPPVPYQRKSASILSAYDDLIENNTRRIQILERMAQALYREWFVHFRFPGHAKVQRVASHAGARNSFRARGPNSPDSGINSALRLPEGWSVRRLDEIVTVNTSTIRRDDEPMNILYVDISSVVAGRVEKIEPMAFADAPGRARRIVRHGDTIWSCVRPNRKSFSLILDPPTDLIVSTGFAVLTPAKVPFSFLHQAVTTDEFVGYLTNRATGAAYPAVTAKDFEAAELVVPDETLLRRFHEHCEPMLLLKENLLRKNLTLRRTRDLLLPKLISGALDVSKLDLATDAERGIYSAASLPSNPDVAE